MEEINKMKKISVVIPAMNEEDTIEQLLKDIIPVKKDLEKEYEVEVMVVDDHSTDSTPDIVNKMGVKLIKNTGMSGKGCALRVGFKEATGDYYIMLDADYSHRAEDLPLFVKELDKGAGLVIGSRILGGSDEYTRIRAFGNIFLTFSVGFFLKRYLSDALNGFKAFKAEVFDDFEYNAKDYEIEIEIIANTLRKGLSVKEISSHERSRAGGVAKSSVVKHGTKFMLRILKEYFKKI